MEVEALSRYRCARLRTFTPVGGEHQGATSVRPSGGGSQLFHCQIGSGSGGDLRGSVFACPAGLGNALTAPSESIQPVAKRDHFGR
jgi:hypothetical protein